jgi:hypothetical protein
MEPFVDPRPLADRWVFRLWVRVFLIEGAFSFSWFVRVDGAIWVVQAVCLSLIAIAGMEGGMRE